MTDTILRADALRIIENEGDDYIWNGEDEVNVGLSRRSLMEQIEALPAADAWQPIETAPMENGFQALLWNGLMVYAATLDATCEVHATPVWLPHLEDGTYSPSALLPTHWMPMPAPPK